MASYAAVAFDLDGTLLNTLEDLYQAVCFTLDKHSLPARSRTEVRTFVGNGIAKLAERAVCHGREEHAPDDELVLRVRESLSDYYYEHCQKHVAPYDGICELIATLSENRVPLAVVTNKPDAAARDLVERFFPERFAFVMGECEAQGIRKKPAPDMLIAACEQLNVTMQQLLYVGDSEVDLDLSRNAGCNCVACSWGFRTSEQLVAAGAHTIINQPRELLTIIQPT